MMPCWRIAMNKMLIAAGLVLTLGAGAAQLSAQSTKLDPRIAAIELRQSHMKSAGASMKTLVGFAKGEVGDAAKAKQAAATLQAVGRHMPKMWPKGTAAGVGKSKAKPEIWTQRKQFAQRISEYNLAATAMSKAAATGDKALVGKQLGALGETCKSCHGSYQVKS
jgi:cytochrome c556